MKNENKPTGKKDEQTKKGKEIKFYHCGRMLKMEITNELVGVIVWKWWVLPLAFLIAIILGIIIELRKLLDLEGEIQNMGLHSGRSQMISSHRLKSLQRTKRNGGSNQNAKEK